MTDLNSINDVYNNLNTNNDVQSNSPPPVEPSTQQTYWASFAWGDLSEVLTLANKSPLSDEEKAMLSTLLADDGSGEGSIFKDMKDLQNPDLTPPLNDAEKKWLNDNKDFAGAGTIALMQKDAAIIIQGPTAPGYAKALQEINDNVGNVRDELSVPDTSK